MPRLSLAMIVRNEEAFLAHCLASVRGLVDEIVILDTGSSDGTVALAEQAGATVLQTVWQDDFSAARNLALAHCQGDWVLILDADEALDALDFPKVRAACAQEAVPAFRLVLRNYLLSGNASNLDQAAQTNHSSYREGAQYRHYADTSSIRLCRRLPGLAFQGRVHELLAPFFAERGLPVGDLDVVVHHYGKTAADREARKQSYYLALALRDAQSDPGQYQAQFNLLNTALGAGDWSLVKQAGQACQALRPGLAEPLVLLGLGLAHQHLGDPAQGLACLESLLAVQPEHSLALVRSGLSLAMLGQGPAALATLERATAAAPGFTLAWLNLGEIQTQLGDPEAARATFCQGLAAVPGDPSLLAALVQVDVRLQRIDLALQDAEAALRVQPAGGAGLWHRLLAMDHLRQGRAQQAKDLLARGLAAFPGDPELSRLLDVASSEVQ